MMAPSLSNSKSSPSFYKDENNVDDLENGEQQPAGNELDLGGADFGDLSELLIPSLNIPQLMDGLNEIGGQPQHCLSSSNSSASSATMSVHSNNSNHSGGSNSFLKGSGSAPRSLGYQIYRTFPYRGSLPQPLQQIINALGEQSTTTTTTSASKSDETGTNDQQQQAQEKKKPCSTNGLRHSRQYKALLQQNNNDKDEDIKKLNLNLNLTSLNNNNELNSNNNNNNIDNNNSSLDNNKELGESSGAAANGDATLISQEQPSFLDSSFFKPPPMLSPRLQQLEKELSEAESNTLDDSENDEMKRLKEQLEAPQQQQFDSPATSSTQWSQLIESLATDNVSAIDGSSISPSLNKSIGDLKNLSLDGISLNFSGESPSKEKESNQPELKQTIEILPPSFSQSPLSGSSGSSSSSPSYLTVSPGMMTPKRTTGGTNATVTSLFIDSKTNAYRIKGQLEQSGDTELRRKQQQLSRTITFSDPTSIHSFFGSNSPTLESSSSQTNSPSEAGSSKQPYRQLTSIFPKIQLNQSTPATPAKIHNPLLRPQPSTLIREYAIKADVNTKGLKRAKKQCMDMEDEYVGMYPFGDDPQMALFAVFDGHSGKNVATKAKEILPSILLKYIQSAKSECGKQVYDMSGVFLSTFKEVDAQLAKFEYEGATATVVLIWRCGQQRFLQSANVGDSSAFLSYAGETLALTKDHRVTDPEEQQRIKDDGISLGENQTRINGLMVSRALGDHFIKHLNCGLSGEPFISPPISLTPYHSHLIVASDGLWDVYSGNRAMEMIRNEQSPEKMASLLLNSSLLSKKSKDNVSVIVATL